MRSGRSIGAAGSSEDDLAAYNRAQAVERALTRVQNLMAELAEVGVQLTSLEPYGHGSPIERAFASLREAGVIAPQFLGRYVEWIEPYLPR